VSKDRVKYRDAETGRVKTGRIVVKPGREADARDLRGMAKAGAQAGYELHRDTMKSD
jgi:hypothetical protein